MTIADLVLFHGHAGDGLLRRVWDMGVLTEVAFGSAPFDRSDLMVVSKRLPCPDAGLPIELLATHGAAQWGWVCQEVPPSVPGDHNLVARLDHLDLSLRA